MRQWIGAAVIAGVCAVAVGAQTPAPAGQKPAGGSGGQTSGQKPASGGPAQDEKGGGKSDSTFVQQAAMDGLAEVQLGQTAAQNATQPEVKQFGQRMVADHGKANDELKALASQKGMTLPTELDAKHKAHVEQMSKMTGAAFDKAYMQHMVSDHQQAVALFQKESKGGADADVKAWAAKTLPTLQEHLKMARETNGKVESGGKEAATKK